MKPHPVHAALPPPQAEPPTEPHPEPQDATAAGSSSPVAAASRPDPKAARVDAHVRRSSDGYPGQRWGLPAHGVGAVAGWRRRLAAFGLDWLLCAAISQGWLGSTGWSTVVFLVQVWVLTALLGASAGQLLLGLQVVPLQRLHLVFTGKNIEGQIRKSGQEQLNRAGVGGLTSAIRTGGIALFFPALLYNQDRRSLADLIAGTVLVRR